MTNSNWRKLCIYFTWNCTFFCAQQPSQLSWTHLQNVFMLNWTICAYKFCTDFVRILFVSFFFGCELLIRISNTDFLCYTVYVSLFIVNGIYSVPVWCTIHLQRVYNNFVNLHPVSVPLVVLHKKKRSCYIRLSGIITAYHSWITDQFA